MVLRCFEPLEMVRCMVRVCQELQEACWKICLRFFDSDEADRLLEMTYAAQPGLLGYYG